jgi:hypothetical protein
MDIYGKHMGYKVTQGKSEMRWIMFEREGAPQGVDITEEEPF